MPDDEVIKAITERAQLLIQEFKRPIIIETDIHMCLRLIATVQVALRHPAAKSSPTMQSAEKFVIDLIEKIDPQHGDIWRFMNFGFNRTFDV
jgi:hypothetical protein